jgi:GNAT superfamily N-acetyltransferase
MSITVHSGYVPGAIGRVAQLHAHYYSQLVGFGVAFESKVARELAEFCERYVEGRDGFWLALDGGEIEASIAIDGSHDGGAHLRWFITSDKVRGSGVGSVLLSTALDFCRACRYERVYLWTFEGLSAARHLYEKFGFRLVHQERGTSWGVEVNEQRFELRA